MANDYLSPEGIAPVQPIKDIPSQIAPAALGGLNALAFGLPEAAIKGIGGDKVRQIVDQYKAQNPGFGVGETAGNIGSFFIPGAGALGAGAKLAGKAGVKGLDSLLGKGAEFLGAKGGTLKDMALRGAGEAAIQAVPRGVAEAVNTQDAGKAAQDAGLNIGFGAGLGAVGKGLGKIGEMVGKTGIGKTVKDEVSKFFEDAVLSSVDVDKGILTKHMNDTARRLGLDKTGVMFNGVGDLKKRTSDFIIDKDLFNKMKREEFLSDQSPLWQKVADDYSKTPVDFSDPNVINAIRNDPAVQEFAQHSAVGQKGVDDIIDEIVGNIQPSRESFNNSKSFLTKEIRRGNKAETVQGEARSSIADTMHDLIDSHAMDLSPELAQLKADYPIIKLLKRASAKEQSMVDAPATQNSETFNRILASGALGGIGASAVPDDQKLGAMAAGMAAPFAARVGGKLIQQGMGNLAGKVIKTAESGAPLAMAERAPAIAGNAVQRLPGLASDQDQTQVGFEQPLPEPDFKAINASYSAPAEAPDVSKDALMQGLETAWSIEDPRGLIERTQPGSKQQFFQDVGKAITNEDGSINYSRASKILFPQNSDEQKHFSESYQTLSKVKEGINDAVKPFIFNDPSAQLNKDTVRNALIDHLKGASQSKFDQKSAESTVDGILNSVTKTGPEKAKLIQKLLETADPIGFGKNGLLKKAGVLK